MDANKALEKKYETIIENVDKDIAQAESYLADLDERYDKNGDIDEVIKIQQMSLNIANLISQKRLQRTELERQMIEFTK